MQNTLLWRHNNDLGPVWRIHTGYVKIMKPIVNSSFCQNLLVDQVSSWLHQNLLKQSFPFYNALLPFLTTCCLTRGNIFEILSYQKLDNKKLATGTELSVKNPSRSGVIKNFPALASQRFKNICWDMYNFKRIRLYYFWIFLIVLLNFIITYYRIKNLKKNRIWFRNEWKLF